MMEEAKAQIKKHRGSQDTNIAGGDAAGLVVVSSNEHFRDFVASSGISLLCEGEENSH